VVEKEDALTWKNRGNSLAKQGNYEGALACYNSGLNIDPNNTDIWYNKSLILGKLDKSEESRQCQDKIKEIQSNLQIEKQSPIIIEKKETISHSINPIITLKKRSFINNYWSGLYHISDKEGELICDYFKQYFSDKNVRFKLIFASMVKDKDLIKSLKLTSNEGAKVLTQNKILYLRNKKASTKIISTLESLSSAININELELEMLYDIEKFYKLFLSKKIEIYYPALFLIFDEYLSNEKEKMFEEAYQDDFCEMRKRKIRPSKYEIIKEIIKSDIDNPGELGFIDVEPIMYWLKKFMYTSNESEIETIARQIHEKRQLELFESNLGKPKQKSFEIKDFTGMSGVEFEEYLAEIFRFKDYEVITTSITGDQGADLILKKNNERWVVQAKCYNNQTVGNSAVQEIFAAKNYYQATKAVVITNSTFTRSAIDLAEANDVILCDGDSVRAYIKNATKI
jgi:tetratricopeptide (TPR) repeat protein